MNLRSTAHDTFVITRHFRQPREKVFAAWSSAQAKQTWFTCNDEAAVSEYVLDFRTGGRELNRVVFPDGAEHRFDGLYLDIVPGSRIIYAYDMYVGADKISVSLATVEFTPTATGSTMVFTEQLVFLDGLGDPLERRHGTEIGLNKLVLAMSDSGAPH
jgi:uncharacterized protein YndB with AHSA1/START domain